MKVGDLVVCGPWTKYPGQIGQIVGVSHTTNVEDCGDVWNWEYNILVNGVISNFIPGDFEVINEKEQKEI